MNTWDIRAMTIEPHQPEVLRSDPEARVIAIDLPAGEELGEHQVHERAWLWTVDGEVELESGEERMTAGPGSLAHFVAAERHRIRAVRDSRLILLLAPWPGPGHPSGHSG